MILLGTMVVTLWHEIMTLCLDFVLLDSKFWRSGAKSCHIG